MCLPACDIYAWQIHSISEISPLRSTNLERYLYFLSMFFNSSSPIQTWVYDMLWRMTLIFCWWFLLMILICCEELPSLCYNFFQFVAWWFNLLFHKNIFAVSQFWEMYERIYRLLDSAFSNICLWSIEIMYFSVCIKMMVIMSSEYTLWSKYALFTCLPFLFFLILFWTRSRKNIRDLRF